VLAAAFGVSLLAIMTGMVAPALVTGAAISLFSVTIVLAWRAVGRDNVTLKDLMTFPAYAFSKLPLYAQIFMGKRTDWVRSKRDSA